MLVFIDESGDSGLKVDQGSSRFFVVTLVMFEDNEEAVACDQRIQLVRRAFLNAVSPYNFFYYGIVINKDLSKLWGEGFRNKSSFYKYACGLVFENAKERLRDAVVVIDRSGSLEFKNQLAKYLRRKVNTPGERLITKVKMQRSEGNNLLQLADYVAGIINRSVQKKPKGDLYRKMLAHREIRVQTWPTL